MNAAELLMKEKVISLSDLQKNPGKALNGPIIKITKNGRVIGTYFTQEELEDLLESFLPFREDFEKELEIAIEESKNPDNLLTLDSIM